METKTKYEDGQPKKVKLDRHDAGLVMLAQRRRHELLQEIAELNTRLIEMLCLYHGVDFDDPVIVQENDGLYLTEKPKQEEKSQ